jgi:hypothetical protein
VKTVPSSTISAIDTYIQNKLTLELSARLKDQSNIVRELADKAEDTVWNRLRRYTIILGIGAAILAFFGLKPLYEIYNQIKPMVSAAEQRVQAVTQTIAQITTEVTSMKVAVDRLSSDVDAQTTRVAQRGGEISQKFERLDATANELSGRVEAMAKSLESKVQQVSKQVDIVSVRKAYPTLGQPKVVTYDGGQWEGLAAKGPKERCINIYIHPLAMGEFSPDQIDKLVEELKNAGYTSYLGMFGIGGPYSQNFGPFGSPSNETSLFYFDNNNKQMAVDVARLVSKALSIKTVLEPRFVDFANWPDGKFVVENAGLDLQLCLFSLQR